MLKQPDQRLGAAASLVRQGAVFADVGTDHAHLPIFLLREGRILRAIASDVREGPLESARQNVREAGLADKVELRLADGLSGMEGCGITDIAICGMGGELIASIIDRAPFVRTGDVRLILQPMSRAQVLRRYLAENGFEVEDEVLCRAQGRIYVCLSSRWTGNAYTLTDAEAQCGKALLSRTPSALDRAYAQSRLSSLERELAGKTAAADKREDVTALADTVKTLRAYLSESEERT